MKIRNGFVSNSSSSSFVVTKNTTTVNVFKDFVLAKIKRDIDLEWHNGEDENWVKENKKQLQYCLEWANNHQNYDKPLTFPYSFNGETDIWRGDDNKIYIDTCNNDQYNDYIEYLNYGPDSSDEYDQCFKGRLLNGKGVEYEDARFKIIKLPEEKTVCVSGYFNPLHVGHVRLFKAAKALGTKLVVVLNNDAQAIEKKGGIIINQDDRKELIEALKCVDECVIAVDKDRTVCKTLKWIEPDIFANGGDRVEGTIPESIVCKVLNIEMIYGVGGDKHDSSTDIIKRAKGLENERKD